MTLPLPPNASVDVYRGFNVNSPYPSIGATIAAADIAGHLKHHVHNGRFGHATALKWTHVLLLPPTTDIRSAYNSQLNAWQSANADTVVVADYPIPGWCTAFLVVLVQRVQHGTPGEHLRVYLDRMKPRLGPCAQGVLRPCCPNALPATIHATIPAGSGCPCLDGTVIALDYNEATGAWSGDATVCSDENLHLDYHCGTHSCEDASLVLIFENHGTAGPLLTNAGCQCSPLHMVFSGFLFPDPGVECDGGVLVIITA